MTDFVADASERSLHNAYGFDHRVMQTLLHQLIKRAFDTYERERKSYRAVISSLPDTSDYRSVQLNALICFAPRNFSPSDFRRGNDYGGFE